MRWFYTVDTLRFLSKHFTGISDSLRAFPDAAAFPRSVLQEIFELYCILLPFSCFTKAPERRCCSLPEIVLLSGGLLAMLRDVPGMFCSSAAREIFRDMHIRLLARLATNNVPESLAGYSLSLPGRDELRRREDGYSTRARDISPPVLLSARPESARLKH
jgi:hypothetical protein